MCQHHDLDWQDYINDRVSNREEYEEALSSCPHCLEDYCHYLSAILESPGLGFTQQVMSRVISGNAEGRMKAYRPLIHYLVAACLTLVFLQLGVFDWIGANPLTLEAGFLSKLGSAIWIFITNLGGI